MNLMKTTFMFINKTDVKQLTHHHNIITGEEEISHL